MIEKEREIAAASDVALPKISHGSRNVNEGLRADEVALSAAAEIIASLATAFQTPSLPAEDADSTLSLPGVATHATRTLETELQKLAIRVRHLEGRAAVATFSHIPHTPSEIKEAVSGSINGSSNCTSRIGHGGQASQQDIRETSPPVKRRRLDHRTLDALHECVSNEANLLQTQRQDLSAIDAQLTTQSHLSQGTLNMKHQSVATLERELLKHQKANEAFQKVLREIGQIVTAVARGDLTMKVRMNAVELDPEITTFKRTINAMMDQLQTFASEVSRVAREVGTEGLLGGQAVIGGIDGTWKELTDNGKLHHTCQAYSMAGSEN